MSITIKEMTVKHECDNYPVESIRGVLQNATEIRWPTDGGYRASWRYCPYCAAPLPQDMAAVIKSVS